jgi:dolichol-phosphate mannosyltransferase
MIYVMLPAYNEEKALARLIPHIRRIFEDYRLAGHVVVVDDGSRDRTAEIAEQSGAQTVLRHPHNMGLAAGLHTGLSHIAALAAADDIIVTMDADDTHNPGLMPRMVQRIAEGFDVVIASRFQAGARVVGVPASRQWFSRLGGWIYRLLLPIPGVRDYTCGYRAYRAAVLQEAFHTWGDQFISETGFAAMPDILLKLRRLPNVLMTELPFILRYDLKPGESKMRVGSNIVKSLRLAVRRARGRLD